ncbi:amidohydrolase [Streptomyces sp. NPDC127190]|uniref:amidohydrolase n=1 Tax=unclassified Streptomyces TaxID=2593676 RepID=UPI0036311C90
MSNGEATTFVNAAIYTGSSRNPNNAERTGWYGSGILQVSNGKIVSCALWSGPGESDWLNLKGYTIIPGFHDSHLHLMGGGWAEVGGECDLRGTVEPAEYETLIKKWAVTHRDTSRQAENDWVAGSGWAVEAFFDPQSGRRWPTREILDRWVPDRPAFLGLRDGHAAWLNSIALDKAALPESDRDVIGGWIERDSSGRPSGTLHEWATNYVKDSCPSPVPDEKLVQRVFTYAQNEVLFRRGITGWQDAGIVYTPGGQADTYRTALANGTLKGRATCAFFWNPFDERPVKDQIADLCAARNGLQDSTHIIADSVKIYLDGIVENWTAALLEPYAMKTQVPGDCGTLHYKEESLREIVGGLAKMGLSTHFHAIGDAAVEQALKVLTAVKGTLASHHQIAHLQLVTDNDLARFAGIAFASIQPSWACGGQQMEQYNVKALGPVRAKRMYRFNSLRQKGAILAGGSDWPVSSMSGTQKWPKGNVDPLGGIYVAMTRKSPEDPDLPPLEPEKEKLSFTDALDAYTTGSAQAGGWGDRSLVSGHAADFVVLNKKLDENTSAEDLREVKVLATYVAGEAVYKAPEWPY